LKVIGGVETPASSISLNLHHLLMVVIRDFGSVTMK